MAFIQNNYGLDNPLETEEERRRREAAMMSDEAVASGGGAPGQMSYGDIFSEYADKRMGGIQDRINNAGQMFMDPQAALRQRLLGEERQAQQEEQANTEVKTQTVKTYGDGSQEQIVKTQIPGGEQQPATRPVAPVAPTMQVPAQQPAQAPAQQPLQPVAPGSMAPIPSMPANLPAQGQIPASMAQRQIPAMNMPTVGPAVNVASAQPGLPTTRPTVQQPPAAVAAAPGASLAQIGQAFTPTAEREVEPLTRQQISNDTLINARNQTDPNKRRQEFARLLADETVDEGTKTLANKFIADDYFKQRNIADAERKIQEASPTDLARYMKEQKKEGSYVKAILLARLGLTELAQKEQERIDPTITMASAVDSKGNKYTVGRDKFGNITTGFDSTGKSIGQDTLADLSAAAMPSKSFLLPQSAGGLMQKTITGPDGQPQVITGQVFTDPQTNSTYFQAGNKRYDTSGLSTPAQNVQNVFGAAAATAAGKAGGEGFAPQPLPAFPGVQGGAQPPAPTPSGPVNPAVIASAQRDLQSLQNEINRIPANDPKREQRLAILNSEVAKTQGIIGQGAPQVAQPLWKQRQNAELAETQAKANIELNKEVSAAEQKVPAAERGKQQAKDIAKQGFADSTYPLLSAVREEISKSTGSKVGAGVDELARVIGASTKGQEAIAKLNVLSGPIKMNIPRFEGAQSDADVREYSRQAGDFANPKLSVGERLAALDAMETLLKKYDKAGTNDWTFGRGPQEKTIDGVTYINDGKGWKKK